ncbi:MAG: hypothetical protein A4E73_01755 [Syntrophaceae bacterium PtaU1.Bin231]|nr:MAG: hypothetical protein A4E73_01755 [Syntrophaceae bacterium PtaU1.Bin231]HOG16803.1 hypothetical protein [Syntrophales bacterium]
MTISAYQVDSVIKAYNKQNKVKVCQPLTQEIARSDRYADTVSLSGKDERLADAYNKISYSVLDVILKEQGR